jgi:hypothetical protein
MNTDRIIDARHAKKLQSEVEYLKSQLTQTQGCVTVSRNGYVQELERELAEAREETIRTREFMDYGFAKAQEELTTVTAQRDRLAVALQEIAEGSSCCACRGAPELASIAGEALQSLTPNVEHIHPLPAGAEVDHGVEVQATENHGKETAGRGLDGAAC